VTNSKLATTGLLAVVIASFLLIAGGCGTDRSAAPGSPVTASDQVVWARELAADGAGPIAQGVTPANSGRSSGSNAGGNGQSSVKIDGALGGVVSNDRITLVIPPGAFAGSRVISLDVQNANGFIECHLFPEGLKFDRPVVLSMSLLNTTGDQQGSTIYWYDPDTGTWVDMQGSYLAPAHGVVASLQHFSTYRAGRAGW
jgi:hypothetical protein